MRKGTANQRRAKILDFLAIEGEVFVEDLADRLDVSAMTIRRDLDVLEQGNTLARTHGGAIYSKRSVAEFAFLERNRTFLQEKQAIAREVSRGIVKPGMTIILDTGTTCLEVARTIQHTEGIKVLTSSLAIASVLQMRDNIELVLLGGNVRKNSPDLSGPLTEENLRQFRVTLAILGADAVDHRGVYTEDLGIAQVSRAMIASADSTVLVVDSSKFARSSFVKYADWKSMQHVVTDRGLSKADLRWLKRAVPDVRCVKTEGA